MADRKPHLLYLTLQYPHVSHTFIRREILGLEELGYTIDRAAINPGERLVDDDDKAELAKTFHVLAGGAGRRVGLACRGALRSIAKLVPMIGVVFALARASDRGLLRQFAYAVEALILAAYCKERNVDHVHVHFGTNAATVAYLANYVGGSPFSMTIHGPVEFDQPYGQSLHRKIAAAKFVVTITHYAKSQILRWTPAASWPKVHIVGCSVGTDWFDSARAIDEGMRGVVSVGRLDEQKGQLLLLEAYAEALGKGFDEDLTLIGDGPHRELIEERLVELGIEDRVHLLGWCDAREIRERLLAAKAFVLPSFAEGLPVSIMEAMALQRPVLASRITGVPELVRDGVDGWLVAPADHQGLVAALVELGSAAVADLRRMGEVAQDRVREEHLTSYVVNELDRLFLSYVEPQGSLVLDDLAAPERNVG